MNYKKSLLIVILALALVFSFSCGAFAADQTVSINNDTALATAFTDVGNGDTITLDVDLTIAPQGDITVSSKNVTLNLNGHKLNLGNACFRIDNCTLTLTDIGSTAGKLTCYADNAVVFAGEGTLAVEGGTYDVKTLVRNSNYDAGVYIENCVINASGEAAIYFDGQTINNDVAIYSGIINAVNCGVDMYDGLLGIGVYGDSPAINAARGAAVHFQQGTASAGLYMKNGTIESQTDYAVKVADAVDMFPFTIIGGNVKGAATSEINGEDVPLEIKRASLAAAISYVDTTSDYYVNLGTLSVLDCSVEYRFNTVTIGHKMLEKGDKVPALVAPVVEGYKFIGWEYDGVLYNAGEGELENAKILHNPTGLELTAKSDIVLNATYEALRFEVSEQAADGSYEITESNNDLLSIAYGDTANLAKPADVDGKDFIGWKETAADGTFRIIETADDSYTYTVKGAVTLEPVFVDKTQFVVKYYDGSVLLDVQTVADGGVIPVVENPVKEGYAFEGWFEASDFSGDAAKLGVDTVDADLTLFAKFTAEEYAISVNPLLAEVADVTLVPNVTEAKVGSTVEVEITPKAGSALSGVYITYFSDGTLYNEPLTLIGDSYFFNMPAADVSIMGNIIEDAATLTYYVDGVLVQTQNYAVGDTIINMKTPAKAGYEFAYWTCVDPTPVANYYVANDGHFYLDPFFPAVEKTVPCDMVFNAVFEALEYTIADASDANTTISDIKVNDADYDDPANLPVVDDIINFNVEADEHFAIQNVYASYKLDGKTIAIDPVLIGILDGVYSYSMQMPAADEGTALTIYATSVEVSEEFIVSYYDDLGGLLAQTELPFGAEVPALEAPAKEGYTFAYWKVAGDDNKYVAQDGVLATLGSKLSVSGDMTITAVYKADTFTVAVVDDETYEVTASGDVEYGQIVALDIPVKEGYRFIGWEEQDITGAIYSHVVADKVQYPVTKATTLKAVFVEDIAEYYLVQFTDGYTGAILFNYHENVSEEGVVAPAAPERAGYTFEGWKLEGGAEVLEPGDAVVFDTDKVYAAQWTADSHKLNFNSPDSENVDYAEDWNDDARLADVVVCDTVVFDTKATAVDTTNDTVDIVPEDKYAVEAIYVTYVDAEGNTLTKLLSVDVEGKATFTVPALQAGSAISYKVLCGQYEFTVNPGTVVDTDIEISKGSSDSYVALTYAGVPREKGDFVYAKLTPAKENYILDTAGIEVYYMDGVNKVNVNYTFFNDGEGICFEMPAADVFISATSTEDAHKVFTVEHNVTISDVEAAGSAVVIASTKVPAGETVTFKAASDNGYDRLVPQQTLFAYTADGTIVRITYDVNNDIYSFVMPSGQDVTLFADPAVKESLLCIVDFDNTPLAYEVLPTKNTVDSVVGNTITVNGNTYTASDCLGFEFDKWVVINATDEPQFTDKYAIENVVIVKPIYEANQYTINKIPNPAQESYDKVTVKVTTPDLAAAAPLANNGFVKAKTLDVVEVEVIADEHYLVDVNSLAVLIRGTNKAIDINFAEKGVYPEGSEYAGRTYVKYTFVMPASDVDIVTYAYEANSSLSFTEVVATQVAGTSTFKDEVFTPEAGLCSINGFSVEDPAAFSLVQNADTEIVIIPHDGYMIQAIEAKVKNDANNTETSLKDKNGNVYSPYFFEEATDSTYNYTYRVDGDAPYVMNFNMTYDNVAIKVYYAKRPYGIDYKWNAEGGNVTADRASYVASTGAAVDYAVFGDTVKFKAEPAEGYTVKGVKVTTNPVNGTKTVLNYNLEDKDLEYDEDSQEYSFEVPKQVLDKAIKVEVEFVEKFYEADIEIVDEAGTDLSKRAEVTLSSKYNTDTKVGTERDPLQTQFHKDVNIYVENIDLAYELKSVTVYEKDAAGEVTDTEVTPLHVVSAPADLTEGTYKFNMPNKDVRVKVVIVKREYDVTYSSNGAQGLIVGGVATTHWNEEVSFVVDPNPGYQIKEVKVSWKNTDGVRSNIVCEGDFETGAQDFESVEPQYNGDDYAAKFTFKAPKLDIENTVISVVAEFEPINYLVYLPEVEHATVTVDGNCSEGSNTDADYLDTVKVNVVPDAGYILDKIEIVPHEAAAGTATTPEAPVAPAIQPEGGIYTFTMPHQDVDVIVTIIKDEFDITYNYAAPEGTVTKNIDGDAVITTSKYDENVPFYVAAEPGYVIDSVKVFTTDAYSNEIALSYTENGAVKDQFGDKTACGYSFTMPETDVTVEVLFTEQTYNVTLEVIGQGKAKLNTTSTKAITADYLEEVLLSTAPADGWYLDSITIAPTDTTLDNIAFTPVLESDPQEQAAVDRTFVMNHSDVEITVVFKEVDYNVHTVVIEEGWATIVTSQTVANVNDTITFTVTPAYGYDLVNVFVENETNHKNISVDDNQGVYTFTMPDADVTVQAELEKHEFQVTFKDYDGKVLGATQYVPYKDSAVAPEDPVREGYTFTGWKPSDMTITKDTVFVAQYTKNSPEIKNGNEIGTSGTGRGTIEVPETALYDETVTITADPDDGYRVDKDSFSVIGESGKVYPVENIVEGKDYVTTAQFQMPDEEVTVNVDFEEWASSYFTDVRTDDWYYEAANFCADREYFKGISEDLFGPHFNMNRAMFVTVLYRIEGEPAVSGDSVFTDVPDGTWFEDAVIWATENGVAKGITDTVFAPTKEVSREQMAAFMYRYAQHRGCDTSIDNENWMDKFPDADQTSEYAKDAVAWAVGAGLMHGKSVGADASGKVLVKLDPQGMATRAQVAQVIKNFVDKVIYE